MSNTECLLQKRDIPAAIFKEAIWGLDYSLVFHFG